MFHYRGGKGIYTAHFSSRTKRTPKIVPMVLDEAPPIFIFISYNPPFVRYLIGSKVSC